MAEEMKVEFVSIDKVTPYKDNPRDNNQDAVNATAESIKKFGWEQPIVVDKNWVIIVGHTRLKAAKQLGLKKVPVLVSDLSEDKAKAYRLADNKTGELSSWETDLLENELAGISMDMTSFGFGTEKDDEEALEADPYTMKVDVPQYEITGAEPDLDMLVDTSKADELIKNIDEADLPENIKDFLKMGATRHYKFNYSNIAEYYAHADKDVQKLFEESALVIIDYDDAIKKGYVKLSERLSNLRIEQNNENDEG